MMDGLLISRPVSMKSKSDIKAEIHVRVAAEEKAFRWVERLAVEDFITRSELEEMVDTIMPSHYQDIVEERFASHICGYPLCSNRLDKVIKQKYHISNNRVYDMTERKCFCSVRCFKASKFLQSQIPEAPVWLRRNKSTIKLLDEVSERNDVKNLQSDEVDISGGLQRLNLRDVEDEEATAYNSVGATATPEIETNAFHDEKPVTRKSAESDSIRRVGNAGPGLSRGLPGAVWSQPKAVTPRSFPGDKEKPKSPLDSPLDLPQDRCLLLINTLVSWLTDETYKFLSSNTAPSDVRSSGAVSENRNTRSFVLPAIDSKSQIQIRRGIVLDKLRSRLQKFLPVLELELLDVTSEVHELVSTLSLTSHNISLTSKDWSLLSLLVLRILSHRLHCVSEAFVRARRRLEIHLTEEYGVSWIDLEASLATHFSVTVPSVSIAGHRFVNVNS